ncbi:NAD(P)-binding protein [Cylindrobasidium torrendii FP15055 ss-10]|uniref:NAD(P)-binding protein n=1 Tax=Cylindrobasidium torrendii FP15055 ss-10 TaxID=1314674 RepID=A0A0D7BR68_9AGAR|nr:NAD(P)-binding protein [Cylindrobasidium torrendii FP15055 ss-10]
MAPRTMEDLLRDHKTQRPLPVPATDLSGKTIIITGANVGLGFEAAKHFASMTPKRMILACRNEAKGNAALAEIGYVAAEVWHLDLCSFKSVVNFSDRIDKELDRLDILVLNAGLPNWGTYELTEDGYEAALQSNCLSNLLLSLRTAPLLIKTAEIYNTISRLVLVTSERMFFTRIDPAYLESPTNLYKAMSAPEVCTSELLLANRYADTKLIEMFYTRTLQACLGKAVPLVVTCPNPGFCISNLRSTLTGEYKDRIKKLEDEYAYSTEEGSRQLVFAAVGGDAEALKGKYTSMNEIREVSDYALSEEGRMMERRTWSDAIDILLQVDGKVGLIIEKSFKA